MSVADAFAPVQPDSLADALLEAILDAPEFQATELPHEYDPADAAWDLGFRLGADWEPATCDCGLSDRERLSFLSGFQFGRRQAESEALAALDREFDREPGSDWAEAERVAVRGARAFEDAEGGCL